MMKIIIVDDDKRAIKALADKLNVYDGADLVGTAYNGLDGLNLFAETRPDLMFLDIELPDISGIEFLERIDGIGDGRCRVVMYTAHGRYMLTAFRNKAFDYLMKPIDDNELHGILRRACIDRRPNMPPTRVAPHPDVTDIEVLDSDNEYMDEQDDAMDALYNEGIAKRTDGKFLVYTNNMDFRLIDIRDVGVFTYSHELRIWELTIADKHEPIRLKRNVNSDMILAISDSFVRISQKHIINIGYLIEVADNTCHFYPPFEKLEDVKVGRFYRRKLIDRFSSF